MDDSQYKTLIEEISKIKRAVENLEGNWDRDRKDFQQFESKLDHLTVEVQQLIKIIHDLPAQTGSKVTNAVDKVSGAVNDAAESIAEEAKKLEEVIKDKKVVMVTEKSVFFLKRFFKWLFRRR